MVPQTCVEEDFNVFCPLHNLIDGIGNFYAFNGHYHNRVSMDISFDVGET